MTQRVLVGEHWSIRGYWWVAAVWVDLGGRASFSSLRGYLGLPSIVDTCGLPSYDMACLRAVRDVHLAVGYYPARFHYSVALRFLGWGGSVRGVVLDPFVGSGVACTSARLVGLGCVGFDINPFAVLLSRVASSRIKRDDIVVLERMLGELEVYRGPVWRPRWSNAEYWHPPIVLEALGRLWGYVHEYTEVEGLPLDILKVSLARASRLFSYADPDIPKLYRGRGVEKLERLISGKSPRDIHGLILGYVKGRARRISKALEHYSSLQKPSPEPRIDRVDVAREPLPQWLDGVDVVFTSPPYLAAHEYTRSTKLELYWLGLNDEQVRELKRREIPYGKTERYSVESETFELYAEKIREKSPKLLKLYNKYFWAVTQAIDKFVKLDPTIIGLFVGPATVASVRVPINDILVEHLSTRGYKVECQYTSPIKARKLFRNRNNRNPNGIIDETLVVLNKT